MQQIMRSIHEETRNPQNCLACLKINSSRSGTQNGSESCRCLSRTAKAHWHLLPNEGTELLPDSAVNTATAGTDELVCHNWQNSTWQSVERRVGVMKTRSGKSCLLLHLTSIHSCDRYHRHQTPITLPQVRR